MASKGKVRLSGRFPAGSRVRLVKVADATVLRSEGGEEVATKEVAKDGTVEFGADVGARYFITGYVNGAPLEVRVRGNEDAEAVSQPPVQPDRVRLTDGSWADEAPEQRDAPELEAAPDLAQDQVKDIDQRSDTPRGTAHPLDAEEPAPYGRQEDVDDDTLQMSDTPTGMATPIDVGFSRQEDVPAGVWQRSHTPLGQAYPLPGDAVKGQQEKESSRAKESRGEPVRAAAEPLTDTAPGKDPKKSRVASATKKELPDNRELGNARFAQSQPSSAESFREGGAYHDPDADRPAGPAAGLDAQGQPLYPDAARTAGVEPAKKPAEA